MKKFYLNISYLLTAIFGFVGTPVFAQTSQPIAMQNVGSQQYIGQSQRVIPTRQQTAPTINSVYAAPMQRVNEIPLYGKNKSMYFYNQPKNQDGLFADGGLYVFGAFSTGKTTEGINAENPDSNFFSSIGSTAHDDMDNPTGITFGFGRTMSSDLNLELMFTQYTGLKYGDFVQNNHVYEDNNDACYDEDGYYICDMITEKGDDYEVTSGGKITSDFFSIGFQYKLNHMFGTLLGGMLKPYIGVQIGFAMNNIDNYLISDPNGYSEGDLMYVENENGDEVPNDACIGSTANNPCTQISYVDGEITHIGKNNRNFGYGLEAGFTIALENNMEIDLFYKRTMLGKVQTSGNVLSSYYAQYTDFYAAEGASTNCTNNGYYYEENDDGGWCYIDNGEELVDTETKRNVESGDLNINEFGIKIKYMF
ncbi:MAG: hypothetical protein ACI4N3_02165 [Alphaproteobacteria bacterium]